MLCFIKCQNWKIMRLLGAFFNIFLFYYFLALCGGTTGSNAESVDNQPVQSMRQEEKACKPGEDPSRVDALIYSNTINRFIIPSPDLAEAT